ncbi:metallophosphoesterase [Oleisolibacter albus]|uniref:metallophosphoesterase n=1 Tax=Oleisolibacter albus TaxID=2171757 RepID=UPI000DF1485C|nr:metallophosphoesterase [Oleisolibacter albus]
MPLQLTPDETAVLESLRPRLGATYLRQRLGLEQDHEAWVLRRGRRFLHLENLLIVHGLIRGTLRLSGLHSVGQRNARRILLREQDVVLPGLPSAFDGFTLLHLSDLHLDINTTFTAALVERVRDLRYDACVLTGDYRARTFGPFDAVIEALGRLRTALHGPLYGILGNHDTIRLVPPMEAMGYRMLMNESVRLDRNGASLYLAGIDDAHYYRTENFHRAGHDIPSDAVSVLLSHTPEVYRRAAHAGFALMLCGHTHGGQICLPGGIPILTDADSPRAYARGAWRYHGLQGYTSPGAGTCIVDIRLNCPPEVTLHRLRCGGPVAVSKGGRAA